MASLKGPAICVRVWDWSETSQTVSLFMRDHGLIRGIAKGAKRERSSFSGGFELLTVGEAVLIAKSAATTDAGGRGGGPPLATITAWDLHEIFPAARRSLAAFHAAMYMADLSQHLVQERDPHPGLFDALVDGLGGLGELPAAVVLLRFQWRALADAGFRPQTRLDVVAGGAIDPARPAAFAPNLGGLTHELERARGQGEVWRVRPETAAVLGALGEADASARTAPAGAVEGASRLLAIYARYVLGRELASFAGVFGGGPG